METSRGDAAAATWIILGDTSRAAQAPVRDQVAAAAERLKLAPDCVSLHAPLAPKATRLGAWAALADAKRDGLTASIGLANFGARHMDELLAVGPAPALARGSVRWPRRRRDLFSFRGAYLLPRPRRRRDLPIWPRRRRDLLPRSR